MLKILFVSNTISPHQLPLACYLAASVGEENFRYAAMQGSIQERIAMGWNCEAKKSWILRAGENKNDREEFLKWWDDADIVLCGERLLGPIAKRIKYSKLVFYMSERWWKPPLGISRMLHPRFACMAIKFRKLAKSPHFHYLPIGYYAAQDIKRLVSFPNRMWLWGYFTSLSTPLPFVEERNTVLKILYTGRMLTWKRIDTLIRAFHLLQQKLSMVQLTLIGDGPEKSALEKLVDSLNIRKYVNFQSSMPMEKIRLQMRNSHIFVLPSNAYEGWGAVVNEAMSEGCAIVASEASGSGVSMINNEVNGFLFQSGDWRQLGGILITLTKDEQLRLKIARNGQRTISECWSPEIAGERLLTYAKAIKNAQLPPMFCKGPMTSVERK